MVTPSQRNNITWITLSVIILVFYILFLGSPANVSDLHSSWYNGFLPEINTDYSYEQQIYSNRDNLSAVSVIFCNYERACSGTVFLGLYDEDGALIDHWEYDASTIANQTEYTLTLDTPISDSREQTYTLRITSDSRPGEGVTFCTVYESLLYNVDYYNPSVWITLLKIIPFILIPFVFFKLRGNAWGTAYAVYCVFIIALHLYMPTNTNDDMFFSRVNNDYSLLSWISYRWNTWTSRFLQEGIGYIVVDRPMLWKFIDTAMVSLLPVFINRSLGAEGYARLYALAVIPLYPILDMRSAGWMCTTWTYMWAVFPAFVVTSIIRKVMDSKTLKWYEYPVFAFCLLLAGNHELMAFYLLCIILFCLIISLVKKSSSTPFLIFASAVSVINLVLFLMSPGAKARGMAEAYHFPGYENFSFFDKVFLGINRCLEVTMSRDETAVFTVMCIAVAVAVFMNTRNVLRRIIAVLPALVQFTLTTLLSISITDRITDVHLRSGRVVGLTVFAVLLLVCLVYSIFNIYRESEDGLCFTNKGMIMNIVLVAGLLTTAAMAFSPTLYVSGYRTSCFTYFGMICITVGAALRVTDKVKPSSKGIATAVISCEAVLLIGRLLSVMGISFI